MDPSNTQHLDELHARCAVSLDRYIEAARSTCALLKVSDGSERYQDALEQRLRENAAQENYQHAREALFAALRPRKGV